MGWSGAELVARPSGVFCILPEPPKVKFDRVHKGLCVASLCVYICAFLLTQAYSTCNSMGVPVSLVKDNLMLVRTK